MGNLSIKAIATPDEAPPTRHQRSLWWNVGLWYLALSGYAYGHLLVRSDGDTAVGLFLVDLAIFVFIGPSVVGAYVLHHIWRTRALADPRRFPIYLSLIGAALPSAVLLALVSAARSLENVFFLILLIPPLGPQLSLVAASLRSAQAGAARTAWAQFLPTLTAVPVAVFWALVVTSTEVSAYDTLAIQLTRLLGGSAAWRSAFRWLSPLFVVYLVGGALNLVSYMALRGVIGKSIGPSATL